MKKIIFVIDTLGCGGAEKALISLLNKIDYTKYDVDLLYFSQEENYYEPMVSQQVTIVRPDIDTKLVLSSLKHSMKYIYLINKWPILFKRLYLYLKKIIKEESYYTCQANNWIKLNKYIPKLKKEYDVCIAFLESSPTYYAFDKIISKKYITFLRTDYNLMYSNKFLDNFYYKKADTICVLSEEMEDNFLKEFPKFKNKIHILPNIIDVNEIIKKSSANINFDENFRDIKIISVGTLRKVKGYDVALKACKILFDKGYKFKWYILGEGEEYSNLTKTIRELDLENIFILLGRKENPYAYVRNADIFVQCSYREGFSNSLFEAKCLLKPIVITNAPGMKNQIEHGKTGLIAEIGNEKEIAKLISKLIDSSSLIESLQMELKKQLITLMNRSADSLEKFYKLLG